MAVAKVILNGETLMDVTSDTPSASNMLNGIIATKNDGTKVTGNITNKSSTDLTVSGATVTAPAGYYANAASKAVSTTTHPNPSASITSSTGVVTASHTQDTGYVTGGTTTGTLNLTTQAGKTVTPTETAQTAVASYRWTTGNVNVAAISSTYVGTGITTRSAADMTVAAQSVTAPAGYYSQAFTKAVTTTTHPNPSASITSSTGVVTASHTQTTGYVTSGTTTGTLNLTTQAAQTIYPSTADQTIASYRWLTGTQTIKSVTTSNLTAANIAEGVVVKVGDTNNASRITQITGTHSGATSYTATISGSGNSNYCYVTYSGTKYYSNNGTFTFKAGDTLTIYCRGNNASVNGDNVSLSSYSYTYTLPIGDITINLSYSSSTSNSIVIYGLVKPTDTLTISAAGTHNVYKYSAATVAAGSAFPPAVTITKAPTIGVNASGVVTASYTGSSSITPTVTSGYVTAGTAGTISTTGTSTYQLTSQAAATYYPSTADQTVASQRWLTGNQTIKSVVTSNLTAENIAEGVTVTVGDSSNASRITQVTGTHSGGPKYTAKITSTGDSNNVFVRYPSATGTKYYTANDEFEIQAGETIYLYASVLRSDASIYVNGERVAYSSGIDTNYTYTVPNKKNVEISLTYGSTSTIYLTEIADEISITSNGDYDVSEYDWATVNVTGGGFTADQIAMRSISGNISGLATSIYSWAFYGCSEITTASFPEVLTIGSSAFNGCNGMTSASFPSVRSIWHSAFYSCNNLESIYAPSASFIGSYAFAYCYKISMAIYPLVSSMGYSAFWSCTNLTIASFPKITSIQSNCFYHCGSLQTALFSSAISIGTSAFASCTNLTTTSFPLVQTISNSAFISCIHLSTISFPSATIINSSAFGRCWNLLSLYLLGSSVVSLASTYVFSSTPILGYTVSTGGVYGSVYVPASLYASYIAANNWSLISSRIVSI